MNQLLAEAAAAMQRAEPTALTSTLTAVLCRHAPGARARLLVIDFRQQLLCPFDDAGQPFAVERTLAGRAFTSQLTQEDRRSGEAWVYLPVTARGERLGVLLVTLPFDAGLEREELESLAELTAHLLLAAGEVTDAYTVAARARPLTLAAELQWHLLPGRSYRSERVAVAGALEPAYSIGGDGFDWSNGDGRLALSVLDADGRGVGAAMTTSLAVTALRNARRCGVDIPDQARLADQALYAQYAGERFVSAVMLSLDLSSGEVLAVDAGSPRTVLVRGGAVEPVALESQLPLGMFEDTVYTAERLPLRPGDRLVIASDGLLDAAGADGGEAFGERDLAEVLAGTANLPPAEMVRVLLRAVQEHQGRPDPRDDAVAVCVDWLGP